jgi:hypothetical protein
VKNEPLDRDKLWFWCGWVAVLVVLGLPYTALAVLLCVCAFA